MLFVTDVIEAIFRFIHLLKLRRSAEAAGRTDAFTIDNRFHREWFARSSLVLLPRIFFF